MNLSGKNNLLLIIKLGSDSSQIYRLNGWFLLTKIITSVKLINLQDCGLNHGRINITAVNKKSFEINPCFTLVQFFLRK
jgi:hypothetical protein